MFVVEKTGGKEYDIVVVDTADHKLITKRRYSFNWKILPAGSIYKLTIKGESDILGLMSVQEFESEKRIEIKLLAVSKENIGEKRRFERIAGNLIAFAARMSIGKYGDGAAISLIPKTELQGHYINKYGFARAGISLFITGNPLQNLLKEYNYE